MREARLPLPTQSNSGKAKCFCGAINNAGLDGHIQAVHMAELQPA
jgi:hypothetical protein